MSKQFESDEAFCQRVLGGDDRVDPSPAYARFNARHVRRSFVRSPYGIAGLAAAAILLIVIFAAPLGTMAGNFLTIFQPKQFAAVDVTSMRNGHLLPNLQAFGTLHHGTRMVERRLVSLQQAAQLAGFHVAVPAKVPDSLPLPARYGLASGFDESFTFSAKKAGATATRAGGSLPPMTQHLDGTTINVAFGPLVYQTWGTSQGKDATGLVIVEAKSPVVRSTGATLQELESYLLALPNVSPELADQIRAIGDLSTTLPVPFMGDKQTAQNVTVNGVQGVAIGDNTGIGAGVIWQKDGVIYFVGGSLKEDQVLDVANGLR
jgi:hypothetical protein